MYDIIEITHCIVLEPDETASALPAPSCAVGHSLVPKAQTDWKTKAGAWLCSCVAQFAPEYCHLQNIPEQGNSLGDRQYLTIFSPWSSPSCSAFCCCRAASLLSGSPHTSTVDPEAGEDYSYNLHGCSFNEQPSAIWKSL